MDETPVIAIAPVPPTGVETPAVPVPMPVMLPPNLANMVERAYSDIDWFFGTQNVAGTNNANQAMIYAVKATLARLAQAGLMPPDSSLVDEAAARSIPVEQLIEEIIAMGRIEGDRELLRVKAKIAVGAATTTQEVLMALLANKVSVPNLNSYNI